MFFFFHRSGDFLLKRKVALLILNTKFEKKLSSCPIQRIPINRSIQFDVHVTMHRVKFLIIKPTRCINFSNLFLEWNSTCFGEFLSPSSGV